MRSARDRSNAHAARTRLGGNAAASALEGGPPAAMLAALLQLGAVLWVLAQAAPGLAAGDTTELYIVFSPAMFTEVHENDAKAALKAWSEGFTRERHLRAEGVTVIPKDLAELKQLIAVGKADVLSVTTDTFAELGLQPEQGNLFVSVMGGKASEEYLLLVHRDAALRRPEDLAGRSLIVQDSARTALAPYWLDTLLLEAGLPPASEHFASIAPAAKLNRVVLPVFFRQVDACLVTRKGFETMVEMNPQLGAQLVALAASPPLYPAIGLYCQNPSGTLREVDFVAELRNLHTTAAGRQILTLFQTERLLAITPADLASSFALIATQKRLLAEWSTKHPSAATAAAAGQRGAQRPAPAQATMGGAP